MKATEIGLAAVVVVLTFSAVKRKVVFSFDEPGYEFQCL